jgi:hypothetical protein
MYQTVACCLLVVGKVKRTTNILRDGYTLVPPLLVDLLLLFERKHTHGDGAYLVVAAGDKIARTGKYIYNLSLAKFALALYALDGAREDPGVATQE